MYLAFLTTIVTEQKNDWPSVLIFISISHTTRTPRKKEENLEDYCFVTQEEFEQGVVMVTLCDMWFKLTVGMQTFQNTYVLHLIEKNPPKLIYMRTSY